MAIRATRGVAHHNHSVSEHSKTEDSPLAIVSADVLGLEIRGVEYYRCVLKVQLPLGESYDSFLGVVGDYRKVIVSTSTSLRKKWAHVTHDIQAHCAASNTCGVCSGKAGRWIRQPFSKLLTVKPSNRPADQRANRPKH